MIDDIIKELEEKCEDYRNFAEEDMNLEYWERYEAYKEAIEIVKKYGWIEFTQSYDDYYGMDTLNCKLPEEDEEILVTDGKYVWEDKFMRDGIECYLDNSGNEFVKEVIAWMPKPKPYIRKGDN